MKKIALSLLAATTLGMSVGSVSAAELKVGVVNLQRILRDAPLAVKAQKKIDAEFSKRDQDLQKIAKQLQTMQDSLDKNGLTMPESERRNKEREFNDLNREFQRKQREFREDLSARQNEEMAAVIDRANKAIKQIFDSEKYDLILQEAVFVSPRLDITDKVVKALADDKPAAAAK